jgi:hypothetical protein
MHMQIEPHRAVAALIEKVRREYDIDVERLTFLTRGWGGICYLVDCSDGSRYFLKRLEDSRVARISASRLDFYLPVTWKLHSKGVFRNLPCLVKTKTGGFYTCLGGLPHILDWEGAMLAPPEHDLFHFVGERFDLFLASYEQVCGPVHLDGDLFGFYFYRRNLEDLTDWVFRILVENTDEERDRNDIKGIVEDCISGWPYLESTIREVKDMLSGRRGNEG